MIQLGEIDQPKIKIITETPRDKNPGTDLTKSFNGICIL
jgi:hypothetical protein